MYSLWQYIGRPSTLPRLRGRFLGRRVDHAERSIDRHDRRRVDLAVQVAVGGAQLGVAERVADGHEGQRAGAWGLRLPREDWPRLAAYLGAHEPRLRDRHTAKNGHWHKTIDRVIEGLADRPKLYLPDFKEATFPVLDTGKTYPHHNLYWVTSDGWDLRVLGGLLLSEVANLFIEAYSVRMRGGYLRFHAQYLRRIRLPRLVDVDVGAQAALASAFAARDRRAATTAALPLYELTQLPS